MDTVEKSALFWYLASISINLARLAKDEETIKAASKLLERMTMYEDEEEK